MPLRSAVAALLLLLAGCSGRYFHDVDGAPAPVTRYDLATLPFDGYWTGIVFNGNKIGYSRLRIARDGGLFRVDAEAVLRLRFLGVDKRVQLRSSDWLNPDLTLRRFAYDYLMDDSRQVLEGEVDGAVLVVRRPAGSGEERLPLTGPLYAMSSSGLYPVVHGLEVGARYSIPVYDGETQALTRVEQAVTAFQESDLFTGRAYRVESRVHGQTVTTWTSPQGLPLLELSLGGVFIAALEEETAARRYLAEAALAKADVLLDFALVRTPPIDDARATTAAELRLIGAAVRPPPAADPVQRCTVDGDAWHCRIRPAGGEAVAVNGYTGSSQTVPTGLPAFGETARGIVGDAPAGEAQVRRLLTWLDANIAKEAVDVFSALDVLQQRKAECQGHSYLYAAFARSLGIPTRVVNGLVYSPPHGGFLYHTWAESHLNGTWVAVDPTFGQLPADATHLKLVEGETLADVAPMLDLIGRVGIKVLALERAPDSIGE